MEQFHTVGMPHKQPITNLSNEEFDLLTDVISRLLRNSHGSDRKLPSVNSQGSPSSSLCQPQPPQSKLRNDRGLQNSMESRSGEWLPTQPYPWEHTLPLADITLSLIEQQEMALEAEISSLRTSQDSFFSEPYRHCASPTKKCTQSSIQSTSDMPSFSLGPGAESHRAVSLLRMSTATSTPSGCESPMVPAAQQPSPVDCNQPLSAEQTLQELLELASLPTAALVRAVDSSEKANSVKSKPQQGIDKQLQVSKEDVSPAEPNAPNTFASSSANSRKPGAANATEEKGMQRAILQDPDSEDDDNERNERVRALVKMYQRAIDWRKRCAWKYDEARRTIEEQMLKDCTFSPAINRDSRLPRRTSLSPTQSQQRGVSVSPNPLDMVMDPYAVALEKVELLRHQPVSARQYTNGSPSHVSQSAAILRNVSPTQAYRSRSPGAMHAISSPEPVSGFGRRAKRDLRSSFLEASDINAEDLQQLAAQLPNQSSSPAAPETPHCNTVADDREFNRDNRFHRLYQQALDLKERQRLRRQLVAEAEKQQRNSFTPRPAPHSARSPQRSCAAEPVVLSTPAKVRPKSAPPSSRRTPSPGARSNTLSSGRKMSRVNEEVDPEAGWQDLIQRQERFIKARREKVEALKCAINSVQQPRISPGSLKILKAHQQLQQQSNLASAPSASQPTQQQPRAVVCSAHRLSKSPVREIAASKPDSRAVSPTYMAMGAVRCAAERPKIASSTAVKYRTKSPIPPSMVSMLDALNNIAADPCAPDLIATVSAAPLRGTPPPAPNPLITCKAAVSEVASQPYAALLKQSKADPRHGTVPVSVSCQGASQCTPHSTAAAEAAVYEECTFKPVITSKAAQMPRRTVEQLADGGRKRHELWLQEQKQSAAAKELEGYTFKPQLQASSKAYKEVGPVISFKHPERNLAMVDAKRRMKEAQRQLVLKAREEKELQNCTFAPQTTPVPGYLLKEARVLQRR